MALAPLEAVFHYYVACRASSSWLASRSPHTPYHTVYNSTSNLDIPSQSTFCIFSHTHPSAHKGLREISKARYALAHNPFRVVKSSDQKRILIKSDHSAAKTSILEAECDFRFLPFPNYIGLKFTLEYNLSLAPVLKATKAIFAKKCGDVHTPAVCRHYM